MKIRFTYKQVIIYELITLLVIVLFLWLDEILDLPYYILGAEPTPINWKESLFESIIVFIFGLVLIYNTKKLLREVRQLRGTLPICAKCKKIRDDKGYWNQIEAYIQSHSDVLFSHGLCAECEKELYGDQDWYKKMKENE